MESASDAVGTVAVVVCLCIWILMMFFCVAGATLILIRHRSKQIPAPLPANPPGITVLRPLKGVDCNMVDNLTSSFKQEYPLFEIIFSVADANDPAIQVVKKLIARYTDVDAKLIIGDVEVGVNPKVNNMIRGYNAAKYDIIWILDSNVYVNPGCMGRSVNALMTPGIGLVHHLPCGVRAQTYGSRLEEAFLNTAHSKMYITINKVAVASCIIGKSNMFRKSDLAHLGGLEYYGKFMSEDNIMGVGLWEKGLRHSMTTDLAYQTLGSLSVPDYFKRRARWIRIRKYTVVAATLFEPFTESILNGLLAAWAISRFLGTSIPLFLVVHYSVWIASDWMIVTTLDPATRQEPMRFLRAWVVRELCALPLWLYAMAGSTVEWRGKSFWLNRDGTVTVARPNTLRKLLHKWMPRPVTARCIPKADMIVSSVKLGDSRDPLLAPRRPEGLRN